MPAIPPPPPGGLRLALALDASGALTEGHFGDAASYRLVDLCPGDPGGTLVAELPGAGGGHAHHHHDHDHGSADKAAGIMQRMRQGGVQVLVGRAFGRNIQRVKTRFVPVLVRATDPDEAVAAVAGRFDDVVAARDAGEARDYLVLR
ncbi:MAG: hypothetical protein EP329_07055 [Deltaproteobacteria bacterium]|nr:MAG: hypothetical protein EP329_07055 [Deltaproteobacteria bacterium]